MVNQIGQSKLAKNNEVLNLKTKTNGKSIVATKIVPLQMVNSNQTCAARTTSTPATASTSTTIATTATNTLVTTTVFI